MRGKVAFACLLIGWLGVAAVAEPDDEDNPHREMVTDKAVCLECHTKLPKPGEHAADYFLVDAPSDNCLGCHDETEHPGVREHAGKEAHPLPGDEHGAIACFTCHDPHPEGAIPGRTVYPSDVGVRTRALAAIRELPVSVERRDPDTMRAMLRKPAAQGEGCLTCHAAIREDHEPWRERLLWDRFMRGFSY